MERVKKMKKKTLAFGIAAGLFAIALSGCGSTGKVKLDPKNPVNIDIWHYYSGNQQNALDNMIKEFNSTVGLEEGIVVSALNCGSIPELSEKVLDTANKKVGTSDMPSIFLGYTNTVYEIDKKGLVANLDDYLSKEELEQYDPAYIEEGRMGEKNELKIFPTAKSTEMMMLNKTDWDKFAAETGADIQELETMEGLIDVSEQYYNWSGGKAFYGRDAMANYLLIGAKQLGTEIFKVENGKVQFQLDKEVMKKIWDGYYVPYIKGYFGAYGKFRSDDAKVGDILAFVGSTTSATYFPKEVFIDDSNSYPVEAMALKAPVFDGGEKYAVQQGAGMAVTKSTPEKEFASVEFMKWFTDTDRNMGFSIESGYLPVKKEAKTSEKLKSTLASYEDGKIDSVMKETLDIAFEMSDTYKFYTAKAFEGSEDARDVLEYSLSDKAKEDKQAIDALIKNGTDREEAIAKYNTQENFEAWLSQLTKELEATQAG